MTERRGHNRMPLEGTASITLPGENSPLFEARLENVSFGGLGVRAEQGLEPQSEVEFRLFTNALDKALCGRAIVRFARKTGPSHEEFFQIGLEFLGADKDQILFLVKRLHAEYCAGMRSRAKGAHYNVSPY